MLLKVREAVLKQLETARERKAIGNALEARIRLSAPGRLYELLSGYAGDLADMFIVSRIDLEQSGAPSDAPPESLVQHLAVTVLRADGEKCLRRWKICPAGAYVRDAGICPRCAEALQSPRYRRAG